VSPNNPPGKSSTATRLAVLYFAVATAALVWPLYPWLGNRIEPRVWGLPFSLIWILVIITSNFCVLVLLYRLRLIDDLEIEENESTRSGRGQQ
jgi:predicted PurR-regulated permease PerM